MPCLASASIRGAHLGEERCPDGLDLLDLCGLDERLQLVGLAQTVSDYARNCDRGVRTVMSTPSSARMRAAYEVASSEVDIVCGRVGVRECLAGEFRDVEDDVRLCEKVRLILSGVR